MKILVTGCAGFIGSIVSEKLLDSGYEVIGFDNLSSGSLENTWQKQIYHLVIGDLKNFKDISMCFQQHKNIDLVIHLAAESIIGYSVTDPSRFFNTNVSGGLNLLEAMRQYNCKNIIVSSTASTYGIPKTIPIQELDEQNPINSYGESKLIFEKILFWYAKAYGFKYNMFRYFNVGGASINHGENRKEETRLVPTALRCAQNHEPLYIFGNDYKTKDGTCVRDYLHVCDVADAHLLAINNLKKYPNGIYNLGSETGYTVNEIVSLIEKQLEIVIWKEYIDRRLGDPETLVASSFHAKTELGWTPRLSDLNTIIKDSIYWYEKKFGRIKCL